MKSSPKLVKSRSPPGDDLHAEGGSVDAANDEPVTMERVREGTAVEGQARETANPQRNP